MDPSESVTYFDLSLDIAAFWQKVPLHTSIVMSPGNLPFYVLQKGEGQSGGTEGGYDWSALMSFKGQIDSTTVARISGRHQMNLIK